MRRVAIFLIGLFAAAGTGLSSSAAEDAARLPMANSSSIANDYCNAFLDDAKKARESRQKAELTALQEDVTKKLAEIKANTEALESWVKRREAFLGLAKDAVIKIYENMDAASAATELAKLDDLSAAAILQQLKPKKAGQILVEMDPKRAATLVATIAANSKLKAEQKT